MVEPVAQAEAIASRFQGVKDLLVDAVRTKGVDTEEALAEIKDFFDVIGELNEMIQSGPNYLTESWSGKGFEKITETPITNLKLTDRGYGPFPMESSHVRLHVPAAGSGAKLYLEVVFHYTGKRPTEEGEREVQRSVVCSSAQSMEDAGAHLFNTSDAIHHALAHVLQAVHAAIPANPGKRVGSDEGA